MPETLIPALDELEVEYKKAMADPSFKVGEPRRAPGGDGAAPEA